MSGLGQSGDPLSGASSSNIRASGKENRAGSSNSMQASNTVNHTPAKSLSQNVSGGRVALAQQQAAGSKGGGSAGWHVLGVVAGVGAVAALVGASVLFGGGGEDIGLGTLFIGSSFGSSSSKKDVNPSPPTQQQAAVSAKKTEHVSSSQLKERALSPTSKASSAESRQWSKKGSSGEELQEYNSFKENHPKGASSVHKAGKTQQSSLPKENLGKGEWSVKSVGKAPGGVKVVSFPFMNLYGTPTVFGGLSNKTVEVNIEGEPFYVSANEQQIRALNDLYTKSDGALNDGLREEGKASWQHPQRDITWLRDYLRPNPPCPLLKNPVDGQWSVESVDKAPNGQKTFSMPSRTGSFAFNGLSNKVAKVNIEGKVFYVRGNKVDIAHLKNEVHKGKVFKRGASGDLCEIKCRW